MHFNYRLVRDVSSDYESLSVREVYYEGGVVVGWTADPVSLSVEEDDDLALDLVRYALAGGKPLLVVEGNDLIREEDPPASLRELAEFVKSLEVE